MNNNIADIHVLKLFKRQTFFLKSIVAIALGSSYTGVPLLLVGLADIIYINPYSAELLKIY